MKLPLGATIESRRRYNACYPAGSETYNYNYAPLLSRYRNGEVWAFDGGALAEMTGWMRSTSRPVGLFLSFSFPTGSLPRVYETDCTQDAAPRHTS
jgi:hypothetical protein